MNDPWDVKSVRRSDQYVSCMKINGVPLLPPVLSKDCYKEMEYYKLLAKEVEKRISILEPYTESSSILDLDAPALPGCPQKSANSSKECSDTFEDTTDKISDFAQDKSFEIDSDKFNLTLDGAAVVNDNAPVEMDLYLSVEQSDAADNKTLPVELPERDCSSPKMCAESPTKPPVKELLLDVDCSTNEIGVRNKHSRDFDNIQSEQYSEAHLLQDEPSSLSLKSFTGSLIDIHSESVKESQNPPKLIRQRSYTLLKPGPLLLAHLEVQSISKGVDMTSISMSESQAKLHLSHKKRRSWDLETAKVKWSSMALELKHCNTDCITQRKTKSQINKVDNRSHSLKSQTAIDVVNKKTNGNSKQNKSEPIQNINSKKLASVASPVRNAYSTRNFKESTSPVHRAVAKTPSPTKMVQTQKEPESSITRNPSKSIMSSKQGVQKEPSKSITHKDIESSKPVAQKEANSPYAKSPSKTFTPNRPIHSVQLETPKLIAPIISGAEDPASKIRELYEKIQKQQLIQMASLVEKQKREQQALQKAFDEQNNQFFKQIKSICPAVPFEVKSAWEEKEQSHNGPVSLSQLINHKPTEKSLGSPIAATLTETNNYMDQCNDVLKKSKDIKKMHPQQKVNRNIASSNGHRTPHSPESNRTSINSPAHNSTSRKLSFDTSSDVDYDQILTDRTNDTLAHFNDTILDSDSYGSNNTVAKSPLLPRSHLGATRPYTGPTHNAINNLKESIHNSMRSICANSLKLRMTPTPQPQEREAATKLVAHVKGYLVRRLMRTERVQATVQTIRDALLCALQLHQDREGIRGADVDLHRRLIQQITAACYSLHETFITSTPAERCAVIAADRARRKSLVARQQTPRGAGASHSSKGGSCNRDIMSQSHSGSFPTRSTRPASASRMSQSSYETFNEKSPSSRPRFMPSLRQKPWR